MSGRFVAMLPVLALVLAAPVARAGAPGDAAEYEFTVTGRRPVTASSALTVPARDFALRPLESGGQMFEAVPGGITAQHTGGGKAEQYFLRGFDADHGTDLAVYFDGVPVNLRSHAHGQGFLDLHFVTRETIMRLDAYKGPYLPRFGDFATAAVVEYVPHASLPESHLSFEGGYWDTYRAVGVVSPRTGWFAGDEARARGLASFEAYHTDGPFRDDEDLWRFSGFLRGELDLAPGVVLSGHLLGYTADWSASGLVPERLVASGALSRFDSLDPTEGGDTTRAQGKLQVAWEPSSRRRVLANAYVVYYDLDLFSNFTFALADPAAGDGIFQKDDRVYTGGRVEWLEVFDAGIPGRLRVGVESRFDDVRVRLGRQVRRRETGFTGDDDVRELSVGPYLTLELLPRPWLRLVGGVRVEHFRFEVRNRLGDVAEGRSDETLVLPKANLVLSPFGPGGPLETGSEALRSLELFGNFGIGFHSNDARAVLADPSDTTLPEALGGEVGLRTRLLGRMEVALSAFYLELEDELVFVGDEGVTEPSGETRRWGVELVARADLTEWLYVRGDAGWTSARFTGGGGPVPQAPRFVAKGALGVRHGGFAAEIGVRSLGDRYASEDFLDPKLSDYTVVDLGLRYRHGPFEVGLAVENLTDTDWRSSEFFFASCAPSEVGARSACPPGGGGPGVGDFHFTPGNPRNVRGWVRVAF